MVVVAVLAAVAAAVVAPGPAAVFDAYITAVTAGDGATISGLIAAMPARPTMARCAPQLDDRACLVDYLMTTVVAQHTRFTIVSTTITGNTVIARLEVRNDLTRVAGVDRFVGSDRVTVAEGRIIAFAFEPDRADAQTDRFFAYMRASH